MTDAEIVRQVRGGDREAYGHLIKRYRQAIYGLAFHHLRSSEDAQDVAQSAFLHAYRHLDQLRDPAAFDAWLRQIATSQCLMWRRRAHPLPIDGDLRAVCDGGMKAADHRLLADQVLACLPAASRLTLTLFYLRSYSLQEIAAFLDVPVTTVKSRLRNARARVRKEHWDMVEDVLRPEPLRPDFVWQVMQKLESGVVRSVAYAPDGRLLAAGRLDGTICLWEAQSGAMLRTWEAHSRAVDELAFAPDSKTLASASRDRTLRLWDVESGSLLFDVTDGGRPASLTFAPNGEVFAHTSVILDTGYRVVFSRAVLRDALNGSIVREIDTCLMHAAPEMVPPESGRRRGTIFHIAFAPDGQTVATCGSLAGSAGSGQEFWGGEVRIWDARTGQVMQTLQVPDHMVKSVKFSPDGRTLAAACTQLQWRVEAGDEEGDLISGRAQLWRVEDGSSLGVIGEQPGRAAQQVVFSPDSARLAVYYWHEAGNETGVFDATTGALQQTFTQTGRCRSAIVFSPDGKRLATGSEDTNVTQWHLSV